MNVGEGSFASRVCGNFAQKSLAANRSEPTSSISFALFCASFVRHRSTDPAACSSLNRSRIDVAVKSRGEGPQHDGGYSELQSSPRTASSSLPRCSSAVARRFSAFTLNRGISVL